MSGCGCGQPVIVNAPTPARVDVETLLLCDVLADGTATPVLVEPIYDTNTGARVGTRTVDPATGDPYTVTGTLQQCDPPPCTTCETLVLCDPAPSGDLPTSDATVTVTAIPAGTPGTVPLNQGVGVPVDTAQAQAFFGGGSATAPAGLANEHAYAVGSVALAPECGTLDPAGSSLVTISARIENDGPNAACGIWGRLALWTGGPAPVLLSGNPASNLATAAPGYQPGAVQTFTRTDVVVPNAELIAGNVYVELNVQVGQDTTPDGGGCTPNGTEGQSFTLDQFVITAQPVPVTGCAAPGGDPVQFMRTLCRNCQGEIVSSTDTELDGTTPYTVLGTPGPCVTSAPCESPTTPITSVGLCLADGTPIAVTVIRDCAGTVTSEGWINLTTGAWTAGAVPVGTVACGDSRSIQVSGTFCDIDAAGEVVGLVLVEYTYDDAGAISSVRLVDAVTGDTYTPTGTVTVCPAGVEQPERDAVVLCDVQADGTSVQFVRDYGRDENGAIVAHSDYLLDGAAYAPTGTVGVCQPADCETELLCDVQTDVEAVLPSTGVPTETWQELPNGVRWQRRGADGAVPGGWYSADAGTPERFDFDRPVSITYSVRFSGPTAAPLRIPAGWYLDSIPPTQHTWNAATRTISPTASVTPAGLSTFRIDAQTAQTMIAPAVVGTQPSGVTSQYGQITVTADQATPFLRTLCRDAEGTVTATDTTLDGTTAYTVVGTADRCPDAEPPLWRDCESVILCDSTPRPAELAVTNTDPSPYYTIASVQEAIDADAAETVWAGGSATVPASPVQGMHSFAAGVVGFQLCPCGDTGTVEISASIRFRNNGPTATEQAWGRFALWNGTTPLAGGLLSNAMPSGSTFTATFGPTTVDLADVLAGRIVVEYNVETNGDTNTQKSWTVDQFTITGTVTAPGCGEQFLRTVCRSGDGPATVTDTTLDAVTPYTPVGEVAQCTGPTPCSPAEAPRLDAEPLLLCDVSDGIPQTYAATSAAVVPPVSHGEPGISSTSTAFMLSAEQVDDLWDPAIGQINPPSWGTDPGGYRVNAVSAAISSTAPTPCGTPDMVRVRVTLRWTNTSGSSANYTDPESTLSLRNGSTILHRIDYGGPGNNGIPQGSSFTATVEGVVPWADVVAGNLSWYWQAVVYQAPNNRKTYRLDNYAVEITDAVPIPGCGEGAVTPFVRHFVYNADGTVASMYDTTVDGDPYTPVGTVQSCSAGDGSAPEPVAEVDRIVQPLCDVAASGTVTPFLRHWTVNNNTGALTLAGSTALDGTTAYNPTGTVTVCSSQQGDQPVQTGIRRVTGTVAQALKTEFPGLQSVSLSVVAGTVNVTMANGAAQPVPAGTTLTWSCADTDDSSLALATFAGAAAGADYLLNWTHKAGAAG